MKKKRIIYIFGLLALVSFSYIFLNYFIGSSISQKIFSNIDIETKKKIKKIIFPYRYIKYLENKTDRLEMEKYNLNHEVIAVKNETKLIKSGRDLQFYKLSESKNFKIDKNNYLQLDMFINRQIEKGIYNHNHKSAFIDHYKDDIVLVSAAGIISFSNKRFDKIIKFTQIENNIFDFINQKDLIVRHSSIKGILIHKNKIFISFTKKIKENCWNTSVIMGNFNYENVKFEKLFSPVECIKEHLGYMFLQSGGAMHGFDHNNIFLSIGDYRVRDKAQSLSSSYGKLLKINFVSKKSKIISIGHRNIQGVYYNKNKNYIIHTEHGPQGGDEININKNDYLLKTKNFGWPISSYGEHYGFPKKDNKELYKKYPLNKSHKKYGFEEPIKYFVPSIGIGAIEKISENYFVVSGMKTKELHFIKFDNSLNISKHFKIKINDRIRDFTFDKFRNTLYLYLEESGSLGIINLKDFV